MVLENVGRFRRGEASGLVPEAILRRSMKPDSHES
jgi:hypothetical protein